jgi:CHAT domain-containing protein/tetratricopeptide (TPR) repeat protein
MIDRLALKSTVVFGMFLVSVLSAHVLLGNDNEDFQRFSDQCKKQIDAGDHAAAVKTAEQASQLVRRSWDSHSRSTTSRVDKVDMVDVSMMITACRQRGCYAAAVPLLRAVLASNEESLGADNIIFAGSLADLAEALAMQGCYSEAIPHFQRCIEIRQRLSSHSPQFAIVHRLAIPGLQTHLALMFTGQGRYHDAELLLRQILSSYQEEKIPRLEAVALGNLGCFFQQQGRLFEAEVYFQRCAALVKDSMEQVIYAAALCNLGLVYYEQDRYFESESLVNQSLTIRKRIFSPGHPSIGENFRVLGLLCLKQGRYREAESLLRQSLAISEKKLGPDHVSLTHDLGDLANVCLRQSRLADAEALVKRAIAIADQCGAGADKYYQLLLLRAQIQWDRQDRKEAVADLKRAIQCAELERSQATGAELERAVTFSQYGDVFERMTALQLELKDPAEAFSAMECGKARSLLDQMAQARADLGVGRSTAERQELRQRELSLKEQVGVIERQIAALLSNQKLARDVKIAKVKDLQKSLVTARQSLYEHYRDERSSNPMYRRLLAADSGTPGLDTVRKRLIGKNDLLLSYLLGKEGGYILAVSQHGAELKALTVNETDAKTLGVKSGPLTDALMGEILENRSATGVMQQLARQRESKKAAEKLAVLWRVLIPEAQRKPLTGGVKRLIVIPHGRLALLPFESLVVEPGESPKYLLDVGPAILYGPSATVLCNLAAPFGHLDNEGRRKTEPVLTVGDPDYSGPSEDAAGESDDLSRRTAVASRYCSLNGRLNPLPFSGSESNWVVQIFEKVGMPAMQLTGATATKARILASIEGRQIVHLACHGFADQSFGNHFGALAFTPEEDRDDPDDGFLTLSEIYGLNLRGTELTIASACMTNYGPQQRGEGVWALSRGFLVAGSRRVVSSNWMLDDEGGATLISYFCHYMSEDIRRHRPVDYAGALLQAKRELRKTPKWSSPFYWAGFVLVGPN